MKIYTRGGDRGETGLLGNRRVSKADPLIEAIGDLDELNAWLGLIVSACDDESLRTVLMRSQRDLFEMGAELASPEPNARLSPERISRLEREIDRLADALPPLKNFILPGGEGAGAMCHVARTVARRAERAVVRLPADDSPGHTIHAYLNRLSDLLFVAARHLNHRAGKSEPLWSGDDT